MAEKNLPIKFFQKRQKDEMDTEGAGSGVLPKWANVDLATEKAEYIQSVLNGISSALDDKRKRNNYIPSVIKLKVNDEALAKSYRKEIGNLFNTGNKLNVIGISGENEALIKVENPNDLVSISKNISKIKNTYPSRSTIVGISAISDIQEFKPESDEEIALDNVLKIRLFNYGNSELDNILIKTFEKYCRDNRIDCSKVNYSREMNIYKVSGVTADSLEELKDFDGIQLITEMPIFNITMDELSDDSNIPVKQPKDGVNYPIVGVLDTGIANIPHLAPWILKDNISYYHEDDINKAHGTFVSGVLVYGDDLEGQKYTGFDGCRLFEAIVMPDVNKQKIHESELVEQIRDAISRNSHIKIWNLSLGTDQESDLHEFSDFAKALDEIQDEHDVLICKSGGNCTNFKVMAPKSRISKSADTIRGLVVGSLTHDKNDTDFADKNHSSPFSRVGPGPSYLIKPDVVHFGGNAGLNDRNQLVINPVKSFSPNGSIATQVGTSFATPRIAAIAAGLNSMLNEDFNSLLLKGLIIHSAKYPADLKIPVSDKLKTVGFGLPSNISEILYNEPNEITLILQDTLEKGTFIDILDFPFPQSMIDEDGYFFGEVTVTLVSSPVLEASQGAEYCQSNIDVFFGSYDEKTERDTSKAVIKNPIGADGRQNVLATSVYSKKANTNFDSSFASERMLLSYGDKYQPVKKWSVNFDEFTPANKEKFLKGPKNWYLKLEGLFRHYTETKSALNRNVPTQDFCLIVTIKDTKKRGNIYNEVTQLLNNFSFIHSNVKINQEVIVRMNN